MSSIREISRLARRVPVVRDVLESSDPRRRAERLARTGIIDAALYAAQLGVPSLTVEQAAAHYAAEGFRWGYTLNVLTDPYVIRRAMIRTDRPALYDYFNSQAWHASTSGAWSVRRYADEHPESLEHPAGPVGHLWERVTRDPETEIIVESGGVRSMPWSEIYPVLFAATAEWAALQRDRRNRYPRTELEHAESLDVAEGASGARASIIMPVWNRGGAMRKAVDSILAQSWEDWELLIIDDGSWDDTVAVAELLSKRDSRIRLIRQDHLGVCAARNAGIAEATGEFIAFLDSDNTWKPHFLRDMVTTMKRESLTSAYATIALDDGETVRFRYGSPDPKSLILGNSIDLNTLVARKDVVLEVGGFDPTLRRAVDYDLILKLAAHSPITHVPTLGAHYDNSEDAADRISTTEAIGWNTSVRLRHSAIEPSSLVGDATIVVLLQRHDLTLHAKLARLSDAPQGTEVRFVGVGVRPDEWRQIRAATLHRDGTSAALHQDGEPFAYVVDRELHRSRSAVFAVIDPRSTFSEEALLALIDEVASNASDAVIPLTLGSDGTVESVGSMLVGAHGSPVAILGGHPAEDARRLGTRVALRALSGRSFAIARELLDSIGGIDPLLYNEHELAGLAGGLAGRHLTARTDLTFTQLDRPREFTVVDPTGTNNALRALALPVDSSDAESAYARAGLRIAHWRREVPAPLEPHEIGKSAALPAPLIPVVTRDRGDIEIDGRAVPRLRWAIKTASPAGPAGETWGDTHFGRSLAAALESLGQETVVDAREAQRRETDYLDDVVIQLRGLDIYSPSPAALSYLWVISHPDMVSRGEAQRFDRVFAASLSWSAQQSERWGIPVEALLQCTDPERFHPEDSTESTGRGGPLFVGNSRGIPRPTVMESVRAGLPLELYGGDWERFLPEGAITGERVDNTDLGRLYSSASVVLNDHWADMQREGFISNRLFDVVAAGGRAFSDDVPGIDQIFGGAVQTYDAVSEIVPFLESDLDARFPTDDALALISERIREEHSFAARARILLDHAIADLAAQGRR
ncbi:glycosyltransferase [Microbacterium sp. NPDC090225]|uniref:glycosyltransferase n=1 Tax=Microbacterium sp. NPDC090225 TaxID=3364207 RepID=UPI003816DB57